MNKILLVGIFALLYTFSTALSAASSRNYWYADGRPAAWYSDQDWMGKLRDDTRLSQLSIPGTHDSGAYVAGGVFALTQRMSFLNQLIAGIRMWDLRLAGPSISPGCSGEVTLYIYHGGICQKMAFRQALEAAVIFLHNHPTETVLMRIKKENISPLNDLGGDIFVPLLRDVLRDTVARDGQNVLQASDFLYNGSDLNPPLRDLRKKIFIFRDYPASEIAIPATTRKWCTSPDNECLQPMAIQDIYNLQSNFELALKWRAVQVHLQAANASLLSDPNKLYVNFTSATALQNSATGWPYFIASGQLAPQNGSGQLWTGFTTINCPAGICLPEFPVSRLGLVFYQGINQLLSIEIGRTATRHRTGLVLMDFPGGGLIGDIIGFNRLHRVSEPPTATPEPASDPGRWYNQAVNLAWNWSGSAPLVNCPVSTLVTREGRNAPTSVCRDTAGLQGSSVAYINIDYSAPRGLVKLSRPVLAGTPTGRAIVQTVAGSFEDLVSGIDPNSGWYRIEDSYGATREGHVSFTPVSPPEGLSVDPNSYFFFQVPLDTRLIPNKPRTYRIKVFASDRAGNPVEVSAETLVR